MKSLRCLIGQHHLIPQFKGKRMYLACTDCPHETPGWDLSAKPPTNSAATNSPANVSRAWPGFRAVATRRG